MCIETKRLALCFHKMNLRRNRSRSSVRLCKSHTLCVYLRQLRSYEKHRISLKGCIIAAVSTICMKVVFVIHSKQCCQKTMSVKTEYKHTNGSTAASSICWCQNVNACASSEVFCDVQLCLTHEIRLFGSLPKVAVPSQIILARTCKRHSLCIVRTAQLRRAQSYWHGLCSWSHDHHIWICLFDRHSSVSLASETSCI